ncbi:MAG: replication factor C large subunit [Candidatus Pacearchaeota archaeon]
MTQEIQSWTEKYRPKNFHELKGQDNVILEIKNFFKNFPNDKKAIILHGPAGVGKTSLAYVIQNELNLEMFELNASDFRNKEQLLIKLKPASEQAGLFKKWKVLLVDEVDGLSMSDKGGLPELVDLIESTKFPIVMTANNIWDAKFGELRNKSRLVAMKELDYKTISLILQDVAKKEHLIIDNQILVSLSIKSKGDVRAALNDLQLVSSDIDLSYISIDERNKQADIFNVLKFVFKNLLTPETLRIYDSLDMPLDKVFLWLEENIPYEYSGEELFNAYEALSIADVFRGRIQRQRYWRFLVYQNIFLSAGISLSKSNPKSGFTAYKKPSRVLKIWMNSEKEKHKKSIISKYAKVIHCSKKKASKEFYFLKSILKNEHFQKQLNLSEQEISYINKLD